MVDTDMTRFDVVDGPQLRPSIERYEQLGELPPRRRLAFVSWLIGALLVSIAHVSVWASALFAAATGTLPGGVAGGYSVLLLVVYFRSLDDDVTTRRGVNGTSYITEEEQLARVLSVIGPFIAVGEPGERVPSSGAAGLYLDHADWKVVVRDLMDWATLIVLRAGKTEGFRWEFETVVRTQRPERVLILVPSDTGRYKAVRPKFPFRGCGVAV